jgi:uncharacterized membrane protein
MKFLFFLLIVILLGGGIWYYTSVYKPSLNTTQNVTLTDTLLIVKDSIINANTFETTPSGFYQGTLPCKNCDGIQRTIAFLDNDRFQMEELNRGKEMPARRIEGVWKQERNMFVLYENKKIISRYRLAKDSLINIENNNVRIPDSMSAQYVLFKKNTAPANPSWKKRKTEGIDIVGNGSDPFWSIEIDNDKLILFKTAAAEKPILVPIERPVITKDSTVYSIRTETSGILRVVISSKFCHDGLGDHLYEYKMTVTYKGQTYRGCGVMLNVDGE